MRSRPAAGTTIETVIGQSRPAAGTTASSAYRRFRRKPVAARPRCARWWCPGGRLPPTETDDEDPVRAGRVVPAVRAVLAAGAPGPGGVAVRVAVEPAVPACRHYFLGTVRLPGRAVDAAGAGPGRRPHDDGLRETGIG